MAVSAVETIGPEDATDHVGENGTVRGVGIGRYPNPQDLVLWGLGGLACTISSMTFPPLSGPRCASARPSSCSATSAAMTGRPQETA